MVPGISVVGIRMKAGRAPGSVLGVRRRDLLAFISTPVALLTLIGTARSASAAPPHQDVLPAPLDHADVVAAAFEQRQRAVDWGDQPFGAVVVCQGVVVGEGPSRVVLSGDPTAHAEMEAVRDACRRLGTRDLSGCVIYATSHPCPMCEAACSWARISRMYVGSAGMDSGSPRLTRC